MIEIWRTIDGFEGLYEVSNHGKVRSLRRLVVDMSGRKRTFNERVLKLNRIGAGYQGVWLSNKGKTNSFSVHRLVAKAFLPNPDNLPEVNHKDEDKENNFVYIDENGIVDIEKSNLEWVSHRYNMLYGTRFDRAMATLNKTYSGLTKKEYNRKYYNEHKDARQEYGRQYRLKKKQRID